MMNRFAVVLVSPRDPNNIGAAARAMANFGFADLRVVTPYAPSWRDAVSAVGAQDIMQRAKLFDALPQALADCTLMLAATALKDRRLDQPVISLPDLPLWLSKQIQGKTALVFGNEKTGLSNADIGLCSAVLHIPTSAKQPSVNLAQSVILTCYELARQTPPAAQPNPLQRASFAQTELVIDELEELMVQSGFKTDYTAQQRKTLLRALVRKAELGKNDLFFIKNFALYMRGKFTEAKHARTH